jgi:hypothetical protein
MAASTHEENMMEAIRHTRRQGVLWNHKSFKVPKREGGKLKKVVNPAQ